MPEDQKRGINRYVSEESDTIMTGPWNDGSIAAFKKWQSEDGLCVGFECYVNGEEKIYVYLTPSPGGDSPDVWLYSGVTGDPAEDAPISFTGFKAP